MAKKKKLKSIFATLSYKLLVWFYRMGQSSTKTKYLARGQLTIMMLIFGGITVIVIGGFITWLNVVVRDTARNTNRSQAFSIAEAGIEYYRWHLAHAQQDFQFSLGAK